MASEKSLTETLIKDIEKKPLSWDKKDNSDELLEDTPIVVFPVFNGSKDNPQYQIYLRSSLTNNNIFRFPIPNEKTEEEALLSLYNNLALLMDSVAERLGMEEEDTDTTELDV